MNSIPKIESVDSQRDTLKWLVISFVIAAIIVANYYFANQSVAIRIAGNIIAGLVILSIISSTTSGKRFWQFAQEARIELRKVVWPTRQETIHATLVIVVVVGITALFLWGIDSVLLWAVSFLTGQRG
jgi:preprotein translocase subunit SecE